MLFFECGPESQKPVAVTQFLKYGLESQQPGEL